MEPGRCRDLGTTLAAAVSFGVYGRACQAMCRLGRWHLRREPPSMTSSWQVEVRESGINRGTGSGSPGLRLGAPGNPPADPATTSSAPPGPPTPARSAPRPSAASWPARRPTRSAAARACARAAAGICSPGNWSAIWCAVWTVNAVWPTPAIPPIAWIPTTAPGPRRGLRWPLPYWLGPLVPGAGEIPESASPRCLTPKLSPLALEGL